MSRRLRNLSFIAMIALMIGLTTGCGNKPSTAPPESRSAGDTSSDVDRLRGLWAVESWEMATEESKAFLESAKETRFKFEGNKVSVLFHGKWQNDSFKLDEKSNPKAITLTTLDDKGEPMKIAGKEAPSREAIYKFEGNLLVIALPMGGGAPRPTEFKPRAGKLDEKTGKEEVYEVTVLTLKRNSEPIKDSTPLKSPVTAASSRPRPATGR